MSQPIVPNPHDRFYKAAISYRDAASKWLAVLLPPEAAEVADLEQARMEPGSFVDHALRERYTDSLFIVPLREGGKLGLYTIVEHFSTMDPHTAYRLAGYVMKIHDRRQQQALPPLPVICAVVYHGEQAWTAPMDMRQWQNPPAGVAHLVMGLPYTLYNLRDLPDEQLPQDPFLRSVAFALKYIRSPRLAAYLPRIIDLLAQADGIDFLEALVLYLLGFVPDRGRLLKEAQRGFGEKGGATVISAADKLRQEGQEEGRAELLLEMFRIGRLSREEARQYLAQMQKEGRISAATAQQVRDRLS